MHPCSVSEGPFIHGSNLLHVDALLQPVRAKLKANVRCLLNENVKHYLRGSKGFANTRVVVFFQSRSTYTFIGSLQILLKANFKANVEGFFPGEIWGFASEAQKTFDKNYQHFSRWFQASQDWVFHADNGIAPLSSRHIPLSNSYWVSEWLPSVAKCCLE